MGYHSAFRPLRRGLGGEAPLRGRLNNSESGTLSVAANRSNTSTLDFPPAALAANIRPVHLSIISEALLREASLDPKSPQVPGYHARRSLRKAGTLEAIKPLAIAILLRLCSFFTFSPFSRRWGTI